jgi:hypothetical protein
MKMDNVPNNDKIDTFRFVETTKYDMKNSDGMLLC